MLSTLMDIHGGYNLTGCRLGYTLYNCNYFLVSILNIQGIPLASTTDNLDFQSLTKDEPLFIDIVNVSG
jgi:hypothetical protein